MSRELFDKEKEERRARNLAFAERGVKFTDIETAYIDADTEIGPGSEIGPCVTIEAGSEIGSGCVIGQGCVISASRVHDGARVEQNSRVIDSIVGAGARILLSVLTECVVGENSTVGPFAYLRPDSDVGRDVKIGDFVEIKNSRIGDGTKVSHLTYVGDSDLGEHINLGCGVVFVNYDGVEKHRSVVEDGAFIGCNVNIVSPVNVGENAYIAAGTTVTTDVPAGNLSVGRARTKNIPGWVERRKKG
ncbi:MAG: UDP-N-acetylglucosamine diphosphorylase [Clostridiales Family XIII bacterium]|jgi:bifunctional UDP-N-acetylglucosamine pyrophosphorylase/glucosamine-1-phosphate N-acetyltransferase|nr:UDP-N-acetylglucosamine diphosphorylase [Clostridiales Family XIII bacterium]